MLSFAQKLRAEGISADDAVEMCVCCTMLARPSLPYFA